MGESPDSCRVYLAGPISGCKPRQQTAWREEFKSLFGANYDFEDPTQWTGKWQPSREVLAIDSCDVVVANMWKESIGTTVGVMHARMRGKAVVVIDPNYIESAILTELIDPLCVSTLKDAARRVKEIAGELRKNFYVKKKDGKKDRFSQSKLAGSVKAACVAAGVDELMLPLQVVPTAMTKLRTRVAHNCVTSADIKDCVLGALADVAESPLYSSEVRGAAEDFKRAWKDREDAKSVDELFDQAMEQNALLEAQVERLRANLEALAPYASSKETPVTHAPPEPRSMAQALNLAKEELGEFLVILPSAHKAAADSAYTKPEKAYKALEMLASCARDRIKAKNEGVTPPGIKEWFREHRDQLPWIDYKAKESQTTMGKYGDERTFAYDGTRIAMPKHLAIGAGGADSTLRIHFETDPKTLKFIVGHVGKHLTNTRT